MNAPAKTLKLSKPAGNTSAAAAENGGAGKSFWNSLAAAAVPIAKLTSNQAQQDPKIALRTRFEKAVAEQVKLVKAAADKSRWFKKLPDGSYELTVRNGNTAMSLNGNCFFQAKDATAAVTFYETVITGTRDGALDDELAKTLRKPREKKAAAAKK